MNPAYQAMELEYVLKKVGPIPGGGTSPRVVREDMCGWVAQSVPLGCLWLEGGLDFREVVGRESVFGQIQG